MSTKPDTAAAPLEDVEEDLPLPVLPDPLPPAVQSNPLLLLDTPAIAVLPQHPDYPLRPAHLAVGGSGRVLQEMFDPVSAYAAWLIVRFLQRRDEILGGRAGWAPFTLRDLCGFQEEIAPSNPESEKPTRIFFGWLISSNAAESCLIENPRHMYTPTHRFVALCFAAAPWSALPQSAQATRAAETVAALIRSLEDIRDYASANVPPSERLTYISKWARNAIAFASLLPTTSEVDGSEQALLLLDQQGVPMDTPDFPRPPTRFERLSWLLDNRRELSKALLNAQSAHRRFEEQIKSLQAENRVLTATCEKARDYIDGLIDTGKVRGQRVLDLADQLSSAVDTISGAASAGSAGNKAQNAEGGSHAA